MDFLGSLIFVLQGNPEQDNIYLSVAEKCIEKPYYFLQLHFSLDLEKKTVLTNFYCLLDYD